MKVNIPVCLVMYQEVDVEDLDGISLVEDDDNISDEDKENINVQNVPIKMHIDAWRDKIEQQVVSGDVVSALISCVYTLRKKTATLSAEISPCFGAMPFRIVK